MHDDDVRGTEPRNEPKTYLHEGPAERARRLVVEQHQELRRLLTLALEQVRRRRPPRAGAGKSLRSRIRTIREVFLRHLACEEALLFPILDLDVPVGPRRAVALGEEHARQRAELLELEEKWTESSGDEISRRFERLALALLDDIAQEERDLLVPDVIRDDQIVIDQFLG